MSAEVFELVPPGVVTVMSTLVPAVPGGEVALMVVAETGVTVFDAVPPNATAVPVTKPVPMMFTTVPPATGPVVGVMAVTRGRRDTYSERAR